MCVGGVVTGQRFTGFLWVHAGNAFLGALIVAFVLLIAISVVGTDARTRVLVLVTLATSLAMFLFAGYQRQVGSQFVWPHGSSNVISSHYIVAPTLLALSALLIRLDVDTGSMPAGVLKGVRAGVVLVVWWPPSLRSRWSMPRFVVSPGGRRRLPPAAPCARGPRWTGRTW